MKPMPTDYSSAVAHKDYVCRSCGVGQVKLWRLWNGFLDDQHLWCAGCAMPGVSVDAEGKRHPDEHGLRWDQLYHPKHGNLAPAVPTEDGKTFWGYTSVPREGAAWWKRLHVYPDLRARVAQLQKLLHEHGYVFKEELHTSGH